MRSYSTRPTSSLDAVLGLKRSGLDALNVALEGRFKRCRREIANGRMPSISPRVRATWSGAGSACAASGMATIMAAAKTVFAFSFLLTTRPPALQAPRGFRTDYGNRNRLLSGFGEGVINFVFLSGVSRRMASSRKVFAVIMQGFGGLDRRGHIYSHSAQHASQMIDFSMHPAHSGQRVVASDEARHGGIGFGVILASCGSNCSRNKSLSSDNSRATA